LVGKIRVLASDHTEVLHGGTISMATVTYVDN